MAETPRRRSKLAGDAFGEPPSPTGEEKPPDQLVSPPAPTTESPSRQAAGPPGAPVTRNPRRLRVVGRVTDDDMVSFNCKMTRGLRRSVRHFAADAEVDIQDVVAAALAEYLSARGVAVPPSELRQPG